MTRAKPAKIVELNTASVGKKKKVKSLPPCLEKTILEAIASFETILVEEASKQIASVEDLQNFEQRLHSTVSRECIDVVTAVVIHEAVKTPADFARAQCIIDSITPLH